MFGEIGFLALTVMLSMDGFAALQLLGNILITGVLDPDVTLALQQMRIASKTLDGRVAEIHLII